MRTLDLDIVRTFLAVVNTGGFSAAAEQVGRTQAAVSLQIKKLEDQLGKPLLDRSSRTPLLTPDGELLLEYAQRIIELNDETLLRIKNNNIAGLLRLGAPEAMAATHLPEILGMFHRNHPSVMLEVTCGLTEELLQRYEHGDFDVVIYKRDPRKNRQGTKLYQEKLAWAASPIFTFPKEEPVPVILSPHPCTHRKRAIEWLEKNRVPWRAVMTLHSLSGRIGAARAGLGMTLLPEGLIDDTLLTVLPPSVTSQPSPLDLAILGNVDKTGLARRFIEHVIHYFETV